VTRILMAASAALMLAQAAGAQRVDLRVGRGPHYVGESIDVQVVAKGFDEEPVPTVEAPQAQAGQLEFLGVSPNISSQVTIINGRVSQSKQVSFVYRYRFWVERPGPAKLGPFRVVQGGTALSTATVDLKLAQIPVTERLHIELVLPPSPIYVGARVPVTLEWWLDLELRKNLHTYTLRAPFFDQTQAFQFIDPREKDSQTTLEVETGAGKLKLYGDAQQRERDGRRYLVISATRTLVPLEVGEFRIAPASVVVNEGTRWQREFFGGRRATRVRKLRAQDRTQRLEVRALPTTGQPASFAGAIGKGFSLEVTADRTVVKAGDPITLTLKLRGEGNLGSAGLPPLSADGGLSPFQFRLPDDEATGVLEQGEKTFVRRVRVLDPSVREIPAVAYSWFDVESGAYQTTRSRPIALAVEGAEVVRAEDVVSDEEGTGVELAPAPPARESARSGALRMTGADLAIERALPTLLRSSETGFGGPWLWSGLYAGPLALVGFALLQRRRAALDPLLLRRRQALQTQQRRILAALKQGDREAAAEISSALRKMLAEVPQARSAELDAFLAECDALTYSPSEEMTSLAERPAFEARARALSAALLEALP